MQANCFIWYSTEEAIVYSKTIEKSYYIELTKKQYTVPKWHLCKGLQG